MSAHLRNAFMNFAKAAIPPGAHEAQRHSMETAFMAGSVSTFRILLDAFERRPNDAVNVVNELNSEHREFTKSLRALRPQPKKTDEEIIERIKFVEPVDWMGVMKIDLIGFLSYEAARAFLNEDITEEQWNAQRYTDPIKAAREYLPFAWTKANDRRGLSAGRSLDHLSVYLWVAGYDSLVASHFFGRWNHYGKLQLVIASALCGFPWREHDDSVWVNSEGSEPLTDEQRNAEIDTALALEALKSVADTL